MKILFFENEQRICYFGRNRHEEITNVNLITIIVMDFYRIPSLFRPLGCITR